MRWKMFPVVVLILAGLSGCSSIGPRTVARDRFDYISAISDSWKAQMLLNVVKLRYADAPVFLDVTSVITQTGYQGTWQFQAPGGKISCNFPLLHPSVLRPRGLTAKGRPSLTRRLAGTSSPAV